MQALGFLPIQEGRPTTLGQIGNAEAKLAAARKIVDAYSYALVVALWDGWHDDRPGLYFVLDGHTTSISSTFARLHSGLHWASRITDLG